MSLVGLRPTDRILDLGCGSGLKSVAAVTESGCLPTGSSGPAFPESSGMRLTELLPELADLRLTGMTSTQRDRLAAALAPAQAARAQQRHRQQRGGRARRATGTLPSTPLLDDAHAC